MIGDSLALGLSPAIALAGAVTKTVVRDRALIPEIDERVVFAAVAEPVYEGGIDPELHAEIRKALEDLGYVRAPRTTVWLLTDAPS